VLLKHRKHSSNASREPPSADQELQLKSEYLGEIILNQEAISPEVIKEFIIATNRKLDNKMMTKLKHR